MPLPRSRKRRLRSWAFPSRRKSGSSAGAPEGGDDLLIAGRTGYDTREEETAILDTLVAADPVSEEGVRQVSWRDYRVSVDSTE